MKNQVKRNIGKYINLILLCLLFTFGSVCTDKIDVDQATTCGVGTSDYHVSAVGTVDTSFDCNAVGLFVINLQPHVEPDYLGFCRLWFEVRRDWEVYRTNYVEFYPGNYATQQLEWGGSLPTEMYEMNAIMQNIQLTSTCPDSVYWELVCWLGDISITEFSNPEKVMEIEYDCQLADTLFYRYDVFEHGWDLEEYMHIAFNIANTTYNIIEDNKNLPCLLVLNTTQEIAKYINGHKQYDDEMYLCGIKGFKDDQGNLVEKAGTTIWTDTINFIPSGYSGSLVAVKSIINQCVPLYNVYYNEIITATTIHELGHQRAILHHHDDFGNPPRPFCIMNERLIYSLLFNLYSNPHFCNECINKIENINW